MAKKERREYTELVLEAKVNRVVEEDYSTDVDDVAKVETTVRLGGRFNRGEVSALVTSIVGRLMVAFDVAEGEAIEDPQPEQEPQRIREVQIDLEN